MDVGSGRGTDRGWKVLRLLLPLSANVFLNPKREKEKEKNLETNFGNVAGDTRTALSDLPLFVYLFQTNLEGSVKNAKNLKNPGIIFEFSWKFEQRRRKYPRRMSKIFLEIPT